MKQPSMNMYFGLMILVSVGIYAQESNPPSSVEPKGKTTDQQDISQKTVTQWAQAAIKRYIACLRGETSCTKAEINQARRQAIFSLP